jgi:Ca2+-binding EF-hand superfamily protein
MKAKVLTASLLMGVMGTAVAGGDLGPGQKKVWQQLDRNGDGMISPKEAQALPKLQERFSALDKDQNAKLEKGEFARFEGKARK